MRPVALLDANVLYRARTRSLLLYLAIGDVIQVRWSEAIQDEWTGNLLRNDPSIDPKRLARTRALMESHFLDASITGHEALIDQLVLSDPDDRHVLAAAIHGGASVIVTENFRHFPASALAPHHLRAVSADDFLLELLATDPAGLIGACALDRANMFKPPMTSREYLNALAASGLGKTAVALQGRADEL